MATRRRGLLCGSTAVQVAVFHLRLLELVTARVDTPEASALGSAIERAASALGSATSAVSASGSESASAVLSSSSSSSSSDSAGAATATPLPAPSRRKSSAAKRLQSRTPTPAKNKNAGLPFSTDGRCGDSFHTQCENGCCSLFGWCGGSADWCQCDRGCDERYGRCGQWWKAKPGEKMCLQSEGVPHLMEQASKAFPEVSFNLAEYLGSAEQNSELRKDLFENKYAALGKKFPGTSFDKLTRSLQKLAKAIPGLTFQSVVDATEHEDASFDLEVFADSISYLASAFPHQLHRVAASPTDLGSGSSRRAFYFWDRADGESDLDARGATLKTQWEAFKRWCARHSLLGSESYRDVAKALGEVQALFVDHEDVTLRVGGGGVVSTTTAGGGGRRSFGSGDSYSTSLGAVEGLCKFILTHFADVEGDLRKVVSLLKQLKRKGFAAEFKSGALNLQDALDDAPAVVSQLGFAQPLGDTVDFVTALKLRAGVTDGLSAMLQRLVVLHAMYPGGRAEEAAGVALTPTAPPSSGRSHAVGVVFQDSGDLQAVDTAAEAAGVLSGLTVSEDVSQTPPTPTMITSQTSATTTMEPMSAMSKKEAILQFEEDVIALLRAFKLTSISTMVSQLGDLQHVFSNEKDFHVVRGELLKVREKSTAAEKSSFEHKDKGPGLVLVSDVDQSADQHQRAVVGGPTQQPLPPCATASSAAAAPSTTPTSAGATEPGASAASGGMEEDEAAPCPAPTGAAPVAQHPITLKELVEGVRSFVQAYGDEESFTVTRPKKIKIRALPGLAPLLEELERRTGPLTSQRWMTLKELAGDVSEMKSLAIIRYRRLVKLSSNAAKLAGASTASSASRGGGSGKSSGPGWKGAAEAGDREENEGAERSSTWASHGHSMMYDFWDTPFWSATVFGSDLSDEEDSSTTSAKVEGGAATAGDDAAKFLNKHWFHDSGDAFALLETLKQKCFPTESLADLASVSNLLGDFAGVRFVGPAGSRETGDWMKNFSFHLQRQLCALSRETVGVDDSTKKELLAGAAAGTTPEEAPGSSPEDLSTTGQQLIPSTLAERLSFAELLQALENLSDYSLKDEKTDSSFFQIASVLRSMIREMSTKNEVLRLSARLGHLRYQFLAPPSKGATSSPFGIYSDFREDDSDDDADNYFSGRTSRFSGSSGGELQRDADSGVVPAAELTGSTTPAPQFSVEEKFGPTLRLVNSILEPTNDQIETEVTQGFEDALEKLQRDLDAEEETVDKEVGGTVEVVGVTTTASSVESRTSASVSDAGMKTGAQPSESTGSSKLQSAGSTTSSSSKTSPSAEVDVEDAISRNYLVPLRDVWTELTSLRRLYWKEDTHLELLDGWELLRHCYPRTDMRSVLDVVELLSRLFYPTAADALFAEKRRAVASRVSAELPGVGGSQAEFDDASLTTPGGVMLGGGGVVTQGVDELSWTGSSTFSASTSAATLGEVFSREQENSDGEDFDLLEAEYNPNSRSAGSGNTWSDLFSLGPVRRLVAELLGVTTTSPQTAAPASRQPLSTLSDPEELEEELEIIDLDHAGARSRGGTSASPQQPTKFAQALLHPLQELRRSSDTFDSDLITIGSLFARAKILARGNVDLDVRTVAYLLKGLENWLSDADTITEPMRIFLHFYVEMQPETLLHNAYGDSRRKWLQAVLHRQRRVNDGLEEDRGRAGDLTTTSGLMVEVAKKAWEPPRQGMLMDRRLTSGPNFPRTSLMDFMTGVTRLTSAVEHVEDKISMTNLRDCARDIAQGTVLLSTQVYDVADSGMPIRIMKKRPGNLATRSQGGWLSWFFSSLHLLPRPFSLQSQTTASPDDRVFRNKAPATLYLTEGVLAQLYSPELVLMLIAKLINRFRGDTTVSQVAYAVPRLLTTVRQELSKRGVVPAPFDQESDGGGEQKTSSTVVPMMRRVGDGGPGTNTYSGAVQAGTTGPAAGKDRLQQGGGGPVLLHIVDLDLLVQTLVAPGGPPAAAPGLQPAGDHGGGGGSSNSQVPWDDAVRSCSAKIRQDPMYFIRAKVAEAQGETRMKITIKDLVGEQSTFVEFRDDRKHGTRGSGRAAERLYNRHHPQDRSVADPVRGLLWWSFVLFVFVSLALRKLPRRERRAQFLRDLFAGKGYGTLAEMKNVSSFIPDSTPAAAAGGAAVFDYLAGELSVLWNKHWRGDAPLHEVGGANSPSTFDAVPQRTKESGGGGLATAAEGGLGGVPKSDESSFQPGRGGAADGCSSANQLQPEFDPLQATTTTAAPVTASTAPMLRAGTDTTSTSYGAAIGVDSSQVSESVSVAQAPPPICISCETPDLLGGAGTPDVSTNASSSFVDESFL
mmetsp:Transcript_10192/g.25034  ORF Transcript_10192/g.25034 Transcript_10192/m.25034 type:complete len:2325 (-) Transcript_10192:483-7457(-)